nr:hypothetical protein [uncultured Draconibacterium sp.]
MNRTKLIQHYKSFFGLEDIELGENDQLMIDWAESLLEDTQNDELKERGIVIVGAGNSNYEALKRAIEVLDIKEDNGKVIAVVGSKQHYSERIPELIEGLGLNDEPKIMELLTPPINPSLHVCQRPNKRENKNKKGRNAHRYGRQPSKF